ncbi:MAG: hypothetical protein ACRDKE_01990, partial [Solirubrobacterales bacterium]
VGILAYFASIALFLAAFVINEKRAILVPIAGVFISTLFAHYLRDNPAEYANQFGQVQLRTELWNAIKYSLPEALLIAGLGVFAARWWSPRVESNPTRTTIPEIKPAVIFFTVCLVPFTIIDLLGTHVHFLYYPWSVLSSTASAFSLIALFCISAVALKPWTVLLPLAMVATSVVFLFNQPGGCFGEYASECLDFAVPALRNTFIAMFVIFLIAVVAGIFALDEGNPAEEPPPPAPDDADLEDAEPAV